MLDIRHLCPLDDASESEACVTLLEKIFIELESMIMYRWDYIAAINQVQVSFYYLFGDVINGLAGTAKYTTSKRILSNLPSCVYEDIVGTARSLRILAGSLAMLQ